MEEYLGQVDSGAIDTVGPNEIARPFEVKEPAVSRRGVGFVAASGSKIKNYGDKRIIGHTEDGEGVSLRIQRAGVKKVLGSVRKMIMGGIVVALDGDRIYVQKKETSKKTRINYEQGQYVMRIWVPVTEGTVAKETDEVLKGNCFAIMAAERVRFIRMSPGGCKSRKSA